MAYNSPTSASHGVIDNLTFGYLANTNKQATVTDAVPACRILGRNPSRSRRSRIYAILFIILNSVSLFGQDFKQKCIYDVSSISDAQIKSSKAVFSYKWNNISKSGSIITKSGDVILFKRWACEHYGADASLITTNKESGIENWKKYVTELGALTMDSSAKIYFLSQIKSKKIEEATKTEMNFELDFSNSIYPEFYLHINELEGSIVFNIYYYKN